jgi:predicted dehydrogenase/putative NADH-flavin reductase
MTAAPVRLAVVGCGAVAERGHLPAAVLCPGVVLTVLVDPDRPRAEALAHRYRVPRVAESHHGLEAHADAAIVAVPHTLHAPIAVDLLERGVHVLVEKPMAVTTAECDAMIAAARRSGVLLAVGLMRRFQPGIRQAKASLERGDLGAVHEVDVRDGFPFTWPARSDSFFRRDLAGGGVLLNTGSHVLDTLLWWFGDGSVADYADDAAGGVEADVLLHLALGNGGRAVVELSVTRNLRNTAILRGNRASLEVPLYQSEPDPMRAQLEDFVEAIRGGRPALVSGGEGRRSVALIEDSYLRRQPLALPWATPNEEEGVLARRSAPARGRRILITGATGFIGGRLVECLAHQSGARVRVLVARRHMASRLARFGVEMFPGSVTDSEAVRAAMDGCEVVFHCAHPRQGKADEILATVRQGAQTLAEAAAEAKVARFVALGSFVVYGPRDGPVDEREPRQSSGWSYAAAKIEEEELLLARHRQEGLPVVLVQPTIVYGPWGGFWTVGQIERLRQGHLGLVDQGSGFCNAVYVDDVVEALLAAQGEGSPGEAYLISAATPVTWRHYYRALERIAGVEGSVCLLDDGAPSEPTVSLPASDLLPYYRARTEVRIDKARRSLGYEPRFDLERGMALTAQWARWARLVES